MGVLQDIRLAIRLLGHDRWFTVAAALTLALGIGANATVFTLVNAVLLRGLPFDNPDRIVALSTRDVRGRPVGISRLDFLDWVQGTRSFEGLALFTGAPMNVSEAELAPEQFNGSYGSANFFSLIGQRPIVGRDFGPQDDRPEAEAVAIIGHRLWQSRYSGDPNVIGRVVRVNSLPCVIVGVMPPGMQFPFNNELWLPLAKLPPVALDTARGVRNFTAFGRLREGTRLSQARAELETVGARLAQEYPETNKDMRPTVVPFDESVAGPQIRTMFLTLMGAVGFVLLIACANVANLLLARSVQRSREVAVRVALGAARWHIVRRLLCESLLLSLLGGAIGLLLAGAGVRAFDAVVTVEQGKPYWMTFTFDAVVFVFLLAICVATSLAFGLAPALHVSKTDVNESLKEGTGRSGTSSRRASRWTSALVVVEIVLTIVLLAGAGLMTRSFLALYRTELGFETAGLLTMRVFLPLTRYPTPEQRSEVIERIDSRLRSISGLSGVGLTTHPPGLGGFLRRLVVDGQPDPEPERRPEVTMVGVSDGYFRTLGVGLVQGRDFQADDALAGREGVIVTQRFVAQHLGQEDPIGRRITLFDAIPSPTQAAPKSFTIIGVAPTIRQRALEDPEPDSVAFIPLRTDPQRGLLIVVRAPGESARIAPLVRQEMRLVDSDLPLVAVQSMDAVLAQQRWLYRVFGSMFAIFSIIALMLSAMGVYAVTAYSVTQRTTEIGIRMALGASTPSVMWLVGRRALVQLAAGLPLGLAGALGAGRLLQSLLAQTSSRDPVTLLSTTVVIVGASAIACGWPAWRAARLSPARSLRQA